MSICSFRFFSVLLFVTWLASSLPAQDRREIPEFRVFGAAPSARDADTIEALVEAYRTAWGAQDVEALMALHADDVEWINSYARILRGSERLGQFLKTRLFANFPADVSEEEAANMRLISIRYVGSDAAVIHLYTDGRRTQPGDEGSSRRTHIHLVLEKTAAATAGSWKVVHTAIMDAL